MIITVSSARLHGLKGACFVRRRWADTGGYHGVEFAQGTSDDDGSGPLHHAVSSVMRGSGDHAVSTDAASEPSGMRTRAGSRPAATEDAAQSLHTCARPVSTARCGPHHVAGERGHTCQKVCYSMVVLPWMVVLLVAYADPANTYISPPLSMIVLEAAKYTCQDMAHSLALTAAQGNTCIREPPSKACQDSRGPSSRAIQL